MHSVAQSATERRGRRADTTVSITRCARRLAEEHGFDGFTMDDLAAAAGVSRRTLFNHVAGKLDAVLGRPPEPPPEALAVFTSGGPHGDLVLDLRELSDAILTEEELDSTDLGRLRRLLLDSPKLAAAVHERFCGLSEQIVAHVQAREGAGFGRRRARVAVGVLVALFDASLEAALDDPAGDRRLAGHFDQSIRYARELLR